MKRLQNIGIMDDDRCDMEDIKHQHEDMITIEKNHNKKGSRRC
jgi:hypothetical protein